VCPEQVADAEGAEGAEGVGGVGAPRRVVVFAGEFLQVLSKSRFKAAVHRYSITVF
jgi:hypothetical protein